MLFRDRVDAGRQLAQALQSYINQPNTYVIALPRGGVVVGHEVAIALHLPLDIVCPRKIGAPFNPELAIGAITETGEGILSQDLIYELGISEEYIKTIMEQEKKKAQWRLKHYREGRPPCLLKDKCVILVDDGLATGSTMRAAIKTIRAKQAKEIIMAVPVAPRDTLTRLEKDVDKAICLATPSAFFAVGQFYNLFDQTTDEEVISLLKGTH
ncbi:MAG TPA: phosphoribosyltransferase [Waddliaceae bacterium]